MIFKKNTTQMIYGTHNSATGNKLVWWQRLFWFIINPISKCQNKTISQQLRDGIKVFNLQISLIGGKWRFTHGLAIYEGDLFETIELMRQYATKDNPIYVQIYLDKMLGSNHQEEFIQLVKKIKRKYCDNTFKLLLAWIEGTNMYPIKDKNSLSMSEHYWTLSWAKVFGTSIIDRIPLPKYHAKKYNSIYKNSCINDFLMLDFYNL